MEAVRTLSGRRAFEPTLLIGIGAKSHFYTLRETELKYIPSHRPNGGAVVNGIYQGTVEVGSFHLFNLSQDPAEAIAKARDQAAVMGIKLENVTVSDLSGRLEEIQRATAEQIAERERQEAQAIADRAALRAVEDAQIHEVVAAGFFPFGRFAGLAFEKAERSYIHWMMSKREEFEEGSFMRLIADRLTTPDYADLKPRAMNPTATLGQVKERLLLDVEVVRVASFEGEFGRVYFVTMVTPEDICVLAKGSFAAEVGERLRIKATVKAHDDYKGQAQTVVNRVVVIEEKAA